MGLKFNHPLLGSLLLITLSTGCVRGYVETADLERQNQGPTACQSRCQEMGMEMGALVLVSNSTPACVCQPVGSRASLEGGAGATGGHVVIAAAAAQAQQDQRQLQQQQAATYSR